MTCDDCDRRVSSRGYLGGEIVCGECARKRREAMDR